MTTDPKRHNLRIVIWSLIWALALIAAGFYHKGNPAKDQIEAAITVVGVIVLMALVPRSTRCVR